MDGSGELKGSDDAVEHLERRTRLDAKPALTVADPNVNEIGLAGTDNINSLSTSFGTNTSIKSDTPMKDELTGDFKLGLIDGSLVRTDFEQSANDHTDSGYHFGNSWEAVEPQIKSNIDSLDVSLDAVLINAPTSEKRVNKSERLESNEENDDESEESNKNSGLPTENGHLPTTIEHTQSESESHRENTTHDISSEKERTSEKENENEDIVNRENFKNDDAEHEQKNHILSENNTYSQLENNSLSQQQQADIDMVTHEKVENFIREQVQIAQDIFQKEQLAKEQLARAQENNLGKNNSAHVELTQSHPSRDHLIEDTETITAEKQLEQEQQLSRERLTDETRVPDNLIQELTPEKVSDQSNDNLAAEQEFVNKLSEDEKAEEHLTKEELAQEQRAKEIQVQDQIDQESLIEEQLAKEKKIQEQHAEEKLVQERLAQEQLAQEQLAQEKLAQEQLAQEQLAQEQLVQKQLAQEQLAQQQLAQEQLAQQQLAQEQLAQELLDKEKLAEEQKFQNDQFHTQTPEDQVEEKLVGKQFAKEQQSIPTERRDLNSEVPEETELTSKAEQLGASPPRLSAQEIEDAELAHAQEKASADPWMYILGNDQLKKRVIRAGENDTRPTHGQQVTVRCSGRLKRVGGEGEEEEGEVIDQHESLNMVLGDGDYIHAFDLAIALMDRGEVSEVYTDSRFAYGSFGRSPDVPPNANIFYTIELVDIQDCADVSTLPVLTRVELGDAKRERGNALYGRQEYSRAIDVYVKALKILDDENKSYTDESVESLQLLLDTRVKCYNNLAAAQLGVEAWDASIKSCDSVLKIQPENVKALFRKGKCLARKGEIPAAIALLKKALQLEPENKTIQAEWTRLSKKCKADVASEKALYQKMLGTEKKEASVVVEPDSHSGRKVWYYAGAVAATAVAAAIATYRYLH